MPYSITLKKQHISNYKNKKWSTTKRFIILFNIWLYLYKATFRIGMQDAGINDKLTTAPFGACSTVHRPKTSLRPIHRLDAKNMIRPWFYL